MMSLLRNKTFFFPAQRRQNQPLQDPLAVCCSCGNVLHSKGYQSLAAVIAAGDVQASPRNAGPQAAPHACC